MVGMPMLAVFALEVLAIGPANGAYRRRRTASAKRRTDLRCQIRWSSQNAPTSRFCASYIDAEGVEHVLAWSPWFAWRRPFPPDESRRAQTALQQLVWDLVQAGWEPVGQTGSDYGEERWYALVFRPAPGQTARTLGLAP
jgi:hypothetical protein